MVMVKIKEGAIRIAKILTQFQRHRVDRIVRWMNWNREKLQPGAHMANAALGVSGGAQRPQLGIEQEWWNCNPESWAPCPILFPLGI